MSPKLKILFVLGILTFGLLGYALAKTFLVGKSPVPHSLVLVDSSDSVLGNCASVAVISLQVFKLPQMQPGSTLTISSTGDESTANEPRKIGTYPVPVSNKAFEGVKQAKQRQEDVLAEIKNSCEQMPSAKASAIFLGLKNGIELLKSKGCNDKANCTAFVRSDLQENVEPQIKAAISGGKVTKLPAPIDNRGIHVAICGIAETKGLVKELNGKARQLTQNRNAESSDLIRQVWRALFAEPQLVTFSSFCPN
ncbi:hypothetical protein BH20ACI2_BH20ACI2_02130 [soil metagenome]